MTKIRRMLLLVFAPLILASCIFDGSNTGSSPEPGATVILQFQSSREELKLKSLQVAQNVYPDVTLRLAQDGTWQLKSIGPMRPLAIGEFAQAVLTSPSDAVLDMNWRPADATIKIRRIHIDAKVFGNVPLRLTGNNWLWGDGLQAGNDLQDVHELKALTLSDYQANPALAATETHHTVLHSHPESGTQSFPMQLSAKIYRFCMDRQDEGADSIRLLDPAGNAVVILKAGDACIEIQLDAGLYTMQHVYGGSGAKRTIFIRPTAAPSPPAVNLATLGAAQNQAYPEYWAVYLTANAMHSDGFLSFNGSLDANYGCIGAMDAAAQFHSYSRTGEQTAHYLFDNHNFFLVTRNGDGVPTHFSYPLTCPADENPRFNNYFYNDGPLLIFLPSAAFPWNHYNLFSSFDITPLPGDQFILSYADDDEGSVYVFRARFDTGTVMSPMTVTVLKQLVNSFHASDPYNVYGALRFLMYVGEGPFREPDDKFQAAFRFFPSGLSPSLKDSTGSWVLELGEVALFSGPNCTGAAMIAKHSGVLSPQPSGNIGSFNASLQLGPNTVATLSQNGSSKILNQSGCLDNQIDLSQQSLEISVTTIINIQTNSCEYCNLAGIDLPNQAISLKGVRLQHTNLAGANFANSDLTQADLRYATLQGANLSNTNLETANLCQASLNANASGTVAQLTGAHLKNVNLSGANLDGANFSSASFYSSTQGSCQSSCADTYILPSCASAYQARINNTDFSNAYLANVDMSGVTASGTKFTGAILFGARFIKANLNNGSAGGAAASFAYAFLQGADFTDATVKNVNFDSAYVDTDSSNNCMQIKLRNEVTGFPGFTSPTASPPVACVVKGNPTTDITIPSCISTVYPPQIPRPATDSTNTCPDGNKLPGGCTAAAWSSPRIRPENSSQINKTCQAKLCNAFTENTCWN